MSELPVAVRTGEPGLVGVSHQVVVEAVLPGEGRPAQGALEWPEAGVAPVVSEESAVGGEGSGGGTQATDQVVSRGSSRPQLLHRVQRQSLVLAAHCSHGPLVLDPDWRLLHLLHPTVTGRAGVGHDGLRVELLCRLHLVLVEDGGEVSLLPGRLQRYLLCDSGRGLQVSLDDKSLRNET